MIKMAVTYFLTNKSGKTILESNSPIDIFIGGVAYTEVQCADKASTKISVSCSGLLLEGRYNIIRTLRRLCR